jgi:hypothetical protein
VKTGRKSLKDELKLFERYSELTEPYFRVLKKHLESEKKDDEKWAIEQLTKAFTKMLPQKVEGDGENGEIIIKVINYASSGNNDPV